MLKSRQIILKVTKREGGKTGRTYPLFLAGAPPTLTLDSTGAGNAQIPKEDRQPLVTDQQAQGADGKAISCCQGRGMVRITGAAKTKTPDACTAEALPGYTCSIYTRIAHWSIPSPIPVVYDLLREFSVFAPEGCLLFSRLARRNEIPDGLTSSLALKHANIALFPSYLFVKALEQIRGTDQ